MQINFSNAWDKNAHEVVLKYSKNLTAKIGLSQNELADLNSDSIKSLELIKNFVEKFLKNKTHPDNSSKDNIDVDDKKKLYEVVS